MQVEPEAVGVEGVIVRLIGRHGDRKAADTLDQTAIERVGDEGECLIVVTYPTHALRELHQCGKRTGRRHAHAPEISR